MEQVKINELRIGNKVYVNDAMAEVCCISEFDVSCRFQFGDTIVLGRLSFEEIRPIELSPELLEACGFEVITDWTADDVRTYDCTHFLDLKFLYISRNMLGGVTLFQNDNISTGIHFEHLHVLQNFIFALTGSELSINLEKVKV